MPCSASEVQVLKLLSQLTVALKTAEQWSSSPPSLWAMQSELPFACDRMDFAQWLQFIFIPKMNELLQEEKPLPTRMALMPMALEWAKEYTTGQPTREPVLEVLAQIDLQFSGAE
tara:strand:- start:679 stop:1023 length:345 start_codon:yes stop_codon:yes gene_type:complete